MSREILEVARVADLQPWDMIAEGRTVIGLYSYGLVETARVTARHEDVDGRCLKRPILHDGREEYLEYPVMVMRPGPIPDEPCERCRPGVQRRADTSD